MKTIGYITLLVLLVITSVFSLNLFMKERSQRDVVDINTFPMQVGEWRGKDLEITEKEYRILETRNLIYREYTNSSQDKLTLFIVYSETNRSVFHPPEVCLIGSGVNIMDKRQEKIDFKTRPFFVNKLYLEKANAKELVLYGFKADDLYTDSYPLQQAYFALRQLLGRRTKGATIRVSMMIRNDEKATLATLKSFLQESARIIDSL